MRVTVGVPLHSARLHLPPQYTDRNKPCGCTRNIDAMHALSGWFSFLHEWLAVAYIPAEASNSVSFTVADSGKFHFIGIWVSLHAWSTVSLMYMFATSCMLYIKLGWKLFFCCAPLHMMQLCKWLWPLKYQSHWTRRDSAIHYHREKALSYWSRFLLNLRQGGHFYKNKMDDGLTCTWQNTTFQYYCSKPGCNTTAVFCGEFISWGRSSTRHSPHKTFLE